MFYRCLHNEFGNDRCDGVPEFKGDLKEIKDNSGKVLNMNSECKLNPKTCGRLVHIEDVVDLKSYWLDKPTFIKTIVKPDGTENKIDKKTKSNKAKKLEAEIAQKGMF